MINNITIVIHTHNEEANIEECIVSAKLLTKNVLVIDMQSTDKTVELAKKQDIQVLTFPFSYYVEPARVYGIEHTKTEWVFILDADERITPKLAEEVEQIIIKTKEFFKENSNSQVSIPTYFKVPRQNIFGRKKWLKHGGWWPDYQMRLINKMYFKNWPKEIHSTPIIEGELGYLQNPILHYFHGNLEKMVKKTMVFENIESQLLFEAGRPVTTTTFFRKFFGELYRRLIKNAGFKDGPIGIIESLYQAYSKTITYIYLYEKKHSRTV
ncbi:MAG TPA: glycosyltransferase family 2 protein [Candidatus Woesebacteria bacterium]|nr:glycosyltransferase family 2 protein [Candidatus Woesebacteria bacterium]